MSLVDQQDVFGSGPHSIVVSAPARQLDRRSFPGLSGEIVLDMGMRGRRITQTGRLQAATAAELRQIISQIESLLDGELHTLIDNCDQEHQGLLIEEIQITTPLRHGRQFWCEYTIAYRHIS